MSNLKFAYEESVAIPSEAAAGEFSERRNAREGSAFLRNAAHSAKVIRA